MLDVLVWAPVKHMCFWEPSEIKGGKHSRGKWPTLLDNHFDRKFWCQVKTFSPILQGFGPWNWGEILSCYPETGSLSEKCCKPRCMIPLLSFLWQRQHPKCPAIHQGEIVQGNGLTQGEFTHTISNPQQFCLHMLNWAVGFSSRVGLGMLYSGLGIIVGLLWMQTLANNFTSERIPSASCMIEALSTAFCRAPCPALFREGPEPSRT